MFASEYSEQTFDCKHAHRTGVCICQSVAIDLPHGTDVRWKGRDMARERDMTDRQRQVLDFIKAEVRRQGFPPTVRDIGEAVGPLLVLDGARSPLRAGGQGAHPTRPEQAAGARGARPRDRPAPAAPRRQRRRAAGRRRRRRGHADPRGGERRVDDPAADRGRPRRLHLRPAGEGRIDDRRGHPRRRLRGRPPAGRPRTTATSSSRCSRTRRP